MSKKDFKLRDEINKHLESTWEQFMADIEELPPKERAAAKLRLLDYVVPKVQAVKDNEGNKMSAAEVLLANEGDNN